MRKWIASSFLFLIIITGYTRSSFETNIPSASQHSKRLERISFGKKKATYTIKMLFSFSCAHCAQFILNELQQFFGNYLKEGVLRFELEFVPFGAADSDLVLLMTHSSKDLFKMLKHVLKEQDKWMPALQTKFDSIDKEGNLSTEQKDDKKRQEMRAYFYHFFKEKNFLNGFSQEDIFMEDVETQKYLEDFFNKQSMIMDGDKLTVPVFFLGETGKTLVKLKPGIPEKELFEEFKKLKNAVSG